MADHNLEGQVIVITGASSGFGKGAARKFAAAGASLVLAARREPLLDDLARECESLGVRAIAVPTDVSEAGEMEQLAQTALSEFGKFDVWVNDAGVAALGRFIDVPLSDHVQVIRTNLLGTLFGSYYALKHFRQRGAGILINISSMLGEVPAPYYDSYVASKYGITGMDKALRQELVADKIDSIRVCTVMPMSHDTPFFDHASNYSGHEVQAVPPLYDPDEVVNAIFDLVTDPKDNVIVGGAGKMAASMHRVMPGTVEASMAKTAEKVQFEKAPPAENSAGAVQQPIPEGSEVKAGRKG